MYKILGADQKEYGPASAAQVRQWLADGRVTAQTKLMAEGSSEWKVLSEFREFDAALTADASTLGAGLAVGPPPRPSAITSDRRPSSGLATTSLVLGLLSLVSCSIITGIPAIITGHIAHRRSRQAPDRFGGGGLATAGFVLGYVSLALLPILAGLMLPALAKAKEKAQRIHCVNNMKQIGLAARIWAGNHGDKFPRDFASMFNELGTPKILVCPGDSSKTVAVSWAEFGPENVSYEYLEPEDAESAAGQMVMFECPIHGNIGLADGSVQQVRQPAGRFRR
ncbi:MAG: DUF4190 domain-containing protein [Verrucomicrobiales bacterium]|nr:DUF4190 domain-containing protein [Verrucomicrobiales bacterium]